VAGTPIRYSPDVEKIEPDEGEAQAGLVETFKSIVETTNKDHGHAFRGVHAKSHAILNGRLMVNPNLPAELAQGLFATEAEYPVLLRISTTPGDPLPDTISVPRGMAIKVIGVQGERLFGSEDHVTQDFVLANGPSFQAPTPKAFLKNLKLLAATTDKIEFGKRVISAVFHTAEQALEAVGGESVTLKSMGGYPHSHPLGESYFSQAPIRYGDYMAKIGVVPLSANFKALEGQMIDVDGREDALREEVGRVLTDEGGQFELRVQLCRDLEKNPIEDASVPWPEDGNPYIAVATIDIEPQSTWTYERSQVVDDTISFSPWHGIETHRPLGAVMRARKSAYAESSRLRGELNGCPMHEPSETVALPA
jgi:hypothetical protein